MTMNALKRTQTVIAMLIAGNVSSSLLVAIVGETTDLYTGAFATWKSAEFVLQTIAIAITLLNIYMALRMTKFGYVRQRFTNGTNDERLRQLQRFGVIRADLLGIPMVVLTVCYYLFLTPSFGYMAIMLLLAHCFILPTRDKCIAETNLNIEPKA
jgi:hypothetical protein